MIEPFDPNPYIFRDQTPVCPILCSRKRSGWWVCLFILWLVSKSFCLQHCTIISCKGGDGGCNYHFTRWARQLMTCFVWDLEPPLLRQLKSGKGIFCHPTNSQCSWSEKTLLDILLSSSPPPGGVILNPLTGLCLAVASDVSTLDLLIFKFRSEALHKQSGNDADWLHKRTSWLLWYEQSWEMAGTWLFQFSWK